MHESEIELLIYNVAQGDRLALEQLYIQMKQRIYLLAYSITKSKQDAEDVLHDTFICLSKKAKSYKGKNQAEQWILRIARNKALDLYRKNKRQEKDNIDDFTNIVSLDNCSNSNLIVEDSLQILNVKERQIVMLHCTYESTHKEIAIIMQLPEGTVRRTYANSIKKLCKEFSNREE